MPRHSDDKAESKQLIHAAVRKHRELEHALVKGGVSLLTDAVFVVSAAVGVVAALDLPGSVDSAARADQAEAEAKRLLDKLASPPAAPSVENKSLDV